MDAQQAREYATKLFSDSLSVDHANFLILHCQLVEQYCHALAPQDMDVLGVAAWLHDIGQVRGVPGHAQRSLEMARELMDVDEVLADCIENHGAGSVPGTPQGKVMQQADKLSLVHPDMIRFLREHGELQMLADNVAKLADAF